MTSSPAPGVIVIGIVVALPAECRSLGIRLRNKGEAAQPSPSVQVMLSGAGPDNARRAAEALAGRGVAALMSWGCCAALAPGLSPGALLLPETLLDQGRRIASDAAWRQRLHTALSSHLTVCGDTLAQSSGIVATPGDKAALARASGAAAVDMESAAIAQVAIHHRLPFVAVRAVADPLRMELPHCVLENTDADGDTCIGGLLLSLARQPRELPALLSLGRHFAAAMASLRRTAKLADPDFLLNLQH